MIASSTTPRPQAPAPNLTHQGKHYPAMPANLAAYADDRRFVCWRYGSTPNGKGKYPKVPFDPHKKHDGKYYGADMDDPATWGTWPMYKPH
jgi:hypothetical protein